MSERPAQTKPSIADLEPVLVLSHSYTYFAPREVLAVRLVQPMAVTFGTAPQIYMDVPYPRFHIRLSDVVEDKIEADEDNGEGRTVRKYVPIGEVHAAVVLYEGKLYYKHLGNAPSVVASGRADARIVEQPGLALPLALGQSVGFGATENAFGETMWWYYIRVYPLEYLRRQLGPARRIKR